MPDTLHAAPDPPRGGSGSRDIRGDKTRRRRYGRRRRLLPRILLGLALGLVLAVVWSVIIAQLLSRV